MNDDAGGPAEPFVDEACRLGEADYARLRVGPYRVILSHGGSRTVDCIVAERRSLVHEVSADAMIERLMR